MTEQGVSLLGASTDESQPELDLSIDTVSLFRQAVFANQGWRLTKVGLRLLSNLYSTYHCTHPDNTVMTGRVLMGMDHAVGGPWGYRGREIYVFDQIVHFELQMCDGSARKFVEFKKPG
jgi:hypothetical protein